jgi:stage V sporulation protein G
MEITEIRIIKKEDVTKKLKAFANVTFDNCFVVRDMKVVEGTKGLFVAMPSRRARVNCGRCGYKGNTLGGRYCSHCGAELPPYHRDENDRNSDHKDIAHPITPEFREKLQKANLEAYEKEASLPGAVGERKPPRRSEERPSMSFHEDED